MSQLFKIVLTGELQPGTDRDTALHNLQQLFRTTESRATQLLDTPNQVIKSGLDDAESLRYLQHLERAGVGAHRIAMAARVAPQAHPAGGNPPPPTASTSVNHDQPDPQGTNGADNNLRVSPLEFTGNGKEYFGIWIVNILLTILTLGIYSAWAKVRNNQYFYGNTLIEGASFQYLASPITILIGRAIALVAVILYAVVNHFSIVGGLLLLLALLIATPWMITRGLRFNAINSSYRNVRFNFEGTYGDALKITLLWPILNALCLGLLTPMLSRKTHEFLVAGSRYGTSRFRFEGNNATYYLFFGKGLLIGLAFIVAFFLLQAVHTVLGSIVVACGYIALIGYFRAGLANLMLNNAELDGHRFESAQQALQLAWIYLTNSLLVVITLGLYTPWAKVRLAKYRAACTAMVIDGNLDQFTAAQVRRTNALGDELADAFDVGFAPI